MTRASTFAIAACLPLLLASCATLDEWSAEGTQDAAPTETAMGQDPDVAALMARMNQLEQEMAEVRIEMSRILPAIERLNTSVSQADTNRAASLRMAPQNDMADAASMTESVYSVHLASYRDREGAMEGWQELRNRFGPVLGALEPRIAEVEIDGRGTFYRLKAGPFENWAGANNVCDYLREASWSCAVMDFSGDAAE